MAVPAPKAPLSGLKLTFNEEFNSLSLNTGSKATAGNTWRPHDAWGNRKLGNELQLYVDPGYKGLGLNPFSVKNGVLDIKAWRTPGHVLSQVGNQKYLSGEITTAGTFSQKYGYFEMRAKMPEAGKGMWPAFWLLNAPPKNHWPPEIDVVEQIGGKPHHVHTSLHTKDGNSGEGNWVAPDVTKGFHTYGVDWTAKKITFYFDGQAVYSRTTPSDMHDRMYMLANLAVGGDWPGSPDATTNWSKAHYQIDYIRAWSHDPYAAVYKNAAQTAHKPLTAVLSDATNPRDLSDIFAAAYTGAGTSRTYSGGQMKIAGVSSTTSVNVTYDANGALTVHNRSAWGEIKNATIKSSSSGWVVVKNFVDAEVTLGNGANTVQVAQAKRGTVVTGSGNDTINVSGHSNGTTDNLMTIKAGDGANKVTFTGESDTRASIGAGGGGDTITVGGQAAARVWSGGGNDRVIDRSTGSVTITGGAGRDMFEFIKGAHASITDFNAKDDRLVLHGVSASNVHVTSSGSGTLVDLGGGSSVNLIGAALPKDQINITYG